jgi:hypothetical protein
MKLIGLVFLGIIASVAFCFLVSMLVATVLKALPGDLGFSIGEGMGFLLAIFVVMPISFLFGSIVTGYFSYYEIEDKRPLLFMAPALYVNLVWMGLAAIRLGLRAFVGVNPPRSGFVTGILIPAAIALLWYLASWVGVLLGYCLRERFAKWWFGD